MFLFLYIIDDSLRNKVLDFLTTHQRTSYQEYHMKKGWKTYVSYFHLPDIGMGIEESDEHLEFLFCIH